MGWVRVSDDYYDHSKFSRVGPLEHALWLAGLAWCNRNRSDGHIPKSTALRLVDWEAVLDVLDEAASSNGVINGVSNAPRNSHVAAVVARRLVKAGLWDVTDTGFDVHDYLDYQPSAEQIAEAAKANAARQKRFRDRHASNGPRNGVTNGVVTHPPKPKPKSSSAPTERVPRGTAQPALDVEVEHIPDDSEVNAGTIVAVWVAACEANGVAPSVAQKAQVGRTARELLPKNDPRLVMEAAEVAGTKGYASIDRELTALNGRTPIRDRAVGDKATARAAQALAAGDRLAAHLNGVPNASVKEISA